MTKKLLVCAGILAAIWSSTANAADGSLAKVKSNGTLVIATMPTYPPLAYKDPSTGELMGVDYDLGEAIGKKLGVKVKWEQIAFAQILPSLQTERIDLAFAGMSDTKERQQHVDFVDYMVSGTQFYTGAAQSSSIKEPADLCGKKVGASRNTNNPQRIAEWSAVNCEAKGAKAIEVIGTDGSGDARNQLKTQRIDAAVQGNETLPYFQSLEPNTYIAIGKPLTEEITGIPVLKTKVELRDAIKDALAQLVADGTYGEILKKYGLTANGVKEFTINAGK